MKKIRLNQHTQNKLSISEPGEYNIILSEAGTEVEIWVVSELGLNQDTLYSLTIRHSAPHTQAVTSMKSVVGKGGSVKLVGKIVIDEGASGCSSFLTQRILLLDTSARGEAVPELEILNNDVKCSHAASISSIPEEQLHYLMARGLSKAKAMRMIAEGFLESDS